MEVHRKQDESMKARVAAVSVALDERDGQTFGHCSRVAGLSMELGRACGLSDDELGALLISAKFHDIGKIGIPDSVLKKRTPFDADDWAIMKAHSLKGERILRAASLDDGVRVGAAVRHHHERFDGNGYPDGLAGEAIPLLARVIAIADTYDAMTSTRNYGSVKTHAQVIGVLRDQSGLQHDPAIAKHFERVIQASSYRVN